MKWFKRLVALVLAVGLVLAMAGCTTEDVPDLEGPSGMKIDMYKSKGILNQINKEREKRGYPALQLDVSASGIIGYVTILEQEYYLNRYNYDASLRDKLHREILKEDQKALQAIEKDGKKVVLGEPARDGNINAYTMRGRTYDDAVKGAPEVAWRWKGNVERATHAAVFVYEKDGNVTFNVWFLVR